MEMYLELRQNGSPCGAKKSRHVIIVILQTGENWCVIKDDMQELLEKFVEADAYVVASPVYVYTVTPQLLAFFSRMRPLFHVYPEKLRNKFGVAWRQAVCETGDRK